MMVGEKNKTKPLGQVLFFLSTKLKLGREVFPHSRPAESSKRRELGRKRQSVVRAIKVVAVDEEF